MKKQTQLVRKLLKMMNENTSYTSRVVDKLGSRVVDHLVKKMESEDFDLKKFYQEQKKINDAIRTEKIIRGLSEERTSGEVNGETIDGFSAFMVAKVLDELGPQQKIRLLSKPTNEIVAIAYKLASRSEI